MFEFDFGHGEDLDLLRETVRSFAADRIEPRLGIGRAVLWRPFQSVR